MIVNARNLSIQGYWKEVRTIQRDLPDVVKLASIPPDPRFCNGVTPSVQFIDADSLTAAQCLFAGTHRLMELDEMAAQEAKRDIDIRDRTRRHLASQGIVAITLPEQSSSK